MDLQSLIMRQSSQVNLTLKKIDKVSENVKKIKNKNKNKDDIPTIIEENEDNTPRETGNNI
jgi:hypothetical protein